MSGEVFTVERHCLEFGECEWVADFKTRAEAEAHAKKLNRESKAIDDPEDRIHYAVTITTLIPVENNQ